MFRGNYWIDYGRGFDYFSIDYIILVHNKRVGEIIRCKVLDS
mgnify:CR=1 FL=1